MPRCRHPRLAASACHAYTLLIWLHPPELRREFGREMRLTFRNRVEDVLNSAGPAGSVFFALHIAVDWLRTFTLGPEEPVTLSILGLGAGDEPAAGALDRSTCSASLFLATMGVALLLGGWYGWLSMNAEILSRHRAF